MHRNKIRLACAYQLLLVLLIIPTLTALAFLFQHVPQRRSTEQNHELFFVLPSPDAFENHINAEFRQVTGLLEHKHGWQRQELASLKQVGMLSGVNKRAPSLALPMPNKMPTNTETVFVLKFHWDYDAVIAVSSVWEQGVKPMAYVDDLHWYDAASRKVQQRALSMVSSIFSTYAYRLVILYPDVVVSSKSTRQRPWCSWVPHATTPMFFMSPTPRALLASQVLVSGATHKDWYPFRHAIARDIVTQRRDSPLRFALVNHPGYDNTWMSESPKPLLSSAPSITGRAFAQRLNRHAACIIDGLHLSYVVAKVFEIPASGCLLFAPVDLVPWLARLGFFETVHFFAYRDLEALDTLVAWTIDAANTDVIDAIRRRSQQLVWRRHVVAHRAALLNGLVVRRRQRTRAAAPHR